MQLRQFLCETHPGSSFRTTRACASPASEVQKFCSEEVPTFIQLAPGEGLGAEARHRIVDGVEGLVLALEHDRRARRARCLDEDGC